MPVGRWREPPVAPLEVALEERAEELYEEAPCGYLSTLPDGTIVKVNRTFLEWTGYRREQLLGTRRLVDLLTAGGRMYHETHYAPLLAMQGFVREISFEFRCADGSRRLPALVNSVLKRDAAGRALLVRTTVFDATDRQRYERELLRARDRERAARERSERLQRLTAALATRLTPDEIAEAVVGELALLRDVAVAEAVLADARRGPARVVRRAHEPAPPRGGRRTATEWRESPPEPLSDDVRVGLVDGRPRFGADGAVLPLTLGPRLLGALSLRVAPGRALEDDARPFLLACARQCAQALERAALHARTAEVAQVLQRSMLQAEPLRDRRVSVGTAYRPAIEALEVCGDWHDAFPTAPERVGVVVGDVVGRGIEAATAMGQLRSATRALAGAELAGPAAVLASVDRFAARVPLALLATAVYAEIELGSGLARFACAGHPPPLLLEPGGEATVLWDGRSLPLGVAPERPRVGEGRLTLTPGARLLLYSDGLVERRGEPLDHGIERLAREARRRSGQAPQELVDGLIATLADHAEGRDDVCVLCVELRGAP